MGGMAPFMIANALAASLAAFVNGVDIELIRQGLRTFVLSADQTPGRMNLFNLGTHHALVDYAHNPASYEAIGGFVSNWKGQRLGVIGGPGDRRDEDLMELGEIASRVFDRIIIKEDEDRRGREPGAVADLIRQGIIEENQSLEHEIVLNEMEALEKALNQVEAGGLVVIFPESVSKALAQIKPLEVQPE
jgi:cyanophycin synthetase